FRPDEPEPADPVGGGEVADPPGGVRGGSVGGGPHPGGDPGGPRVVQAGDDRPFDGTRHPHEGLLQLVGGSEVVHVLLFDVGDHEPLQADVLESPERLVDLEDQQVVGAEVAVGPEGDQLSPGHERRVGAGGADPGDQQRRGGGLAVGPGRADDGPLGGDHLEQLGPPPHRDPGAAGGFQLGVVVGHRRRRHDQLRLADTVGTAPLPHFDAQRRQEVHGGAGSQIGAADAVASPGEDLRQGAHAGSADADDVDSLGDSGHADAISIMARAMTIAASGLAIFVAASAMRRRAWGSPMRDFTTAGSSPMRSSATTTAAPASRSAAALRSWWRPEPKPPGTSTAGVAVAVSSATEPPARATTRSQAAKNASISVMKSSTTHR